MPKTSKKTITATDTANTNVFLIAKCSFRGFIAPVHRKGPGMCTMIPGSFSLNRLATKCSGL